MAGTPLRRSARRAELALLRKCVSWRSWRLWLDLRRFRASSSSPAQALQALLVHCSTSVPFYRRAFAGLEANQPFEFDAVPIITKATLQASFAELIAINPAGAVQGAAPFWITTTGGSTGVPTSFLKSREDMLANMSVVTDIFREHHVPRFGPIFDLGLHWSGQPLVEPRILPGAHVCWNFRGHSHDVAWLRQQCLDIIATASPVALFGAPSRLLPFASLCRELGVSIRPRVVISTFEHLEPSSSEFLTSVFAAPVVQLYGTSEIGVAARACAAGRWHFDPHRVVAEVVDDADGYVGDDEVGRLVLTSLGRRVMPLVRFDTGDRARWRDRACPCGRAGASVQALEGRAAAMVVAAGGARFSPFAVFRFVADLGVTDWQLVQRRPGALELVLPRDAAFTDEDAARLASRTSRYLESDTAVTVRRTGEFVLSPSGKRNAFVLLAEQAPVRGVDARSDAGGVDRLADQQRAGERVEVRPHPGVLGDRVDVAHPPLQG